MSGECAGISGQSGAVEEAIAAISDALGRDPGEAEKLARKATDTFGKVPRVMRLHARALRLQGRDDAAGAIELEAIRASRHDPQLAEAARLISAHYAQAAQAILEGVLRHSPDDPVANLMLGAGLGETGHFTRAEALLRRAIDAAPGYLEARTKLAGQLLLQCRPAEALAMIDSAIAMAAPPPAILRFRASVLSELADHRDAGAIYRALLRSDPGEVADWISLGDSLRTLGDAQASTQAYRSALARNAAYGRSWWSLVSLNASALTADDIVRLEQIIATAGGDADNRTYLHFALATAYDHLGRYEQAFEQFAIGNRLCRTLRSYDPDTVTQEVERAAAVLTPEYLQASKDIGNPSSAPIFIVGMPRSGSTLVEQILASHPAVEGTAELPIIPILIQTWLTDRGAGPDISYRDLLPSMTPDEAYALGSEYLARAHVYRKTAKPFFVDKLPHNWADVAFIRAILPNARIVDVRRTPMDCCFSNYKLMFAQGHPASYSLDEIARYYADYVAMMRQIDRSAPGLVHRIVYEALVDDVEAETRRLLAYVGVPYDAACLAFHLTDRAVATASSEQVRKPLNRRGIGACAPYEHWLGPLRDRLGVLVDTYADAT